jgi:hypothetical protein
MHNRLYLCVASLLQGKMYIYFHYASLYAVPVDETTVIMAMLPVVNCLYLTTA